MNEELCQLISSCSLLHRNNLRALVAKAPAGAIVECGVYRGGSAAALIEAAAGKRAVWLFDSFVGFPEHDKVDEFPGMPILGKGTAAIPKEQMVRNIEGLGVSMDNVKVVAGFFADSCKAERVNVGDIALLHFDGDLYQSFMDVMGYLLDKVVPGGYVVIHDYPGFPGCKAAVDKIFIPELIKQLDAESAYIIMP